MQTNSRNRPNVCKNNDLCLAFSLLEIAVVLVIISLIIAGIISGNSLIKDARIQKVIREINENREVLEIFKEKYNAYPGDMIDAYNIWGTNCHATSSICNGDGDSIIEYEAIAPFNSDYEDEMFWKHISLAGLTKIIYSGSGYDPGDGAPASVVEGASWRAVSQRTAMYSDSTVINKIFWMLGRPDNYNNLGVFTPEEAYKMDLKLDDGGPASGAMWSQNSTDVGFGDCITAESPPLGYDLTTTDEGCRLRFWENAHLEP